MNKPNVTKFLRNVRSAAAKHSPEILTGIGIAGMVATTVLAVKATPKALQLIEEEKDRRADEYGEVIPSDEYDEIRRLTHLDIVKVAWKPYIPALVTGMFSIICLVGASSVSARRNAALAAAYKLSETALTDYKEKVIETIGERKEKEVRDKVAKDKIEKNPVSKTEVIITDKGNTLCYDSISGRYFKSDIDKIKKIVNELNRRMLNEMYISLNEFYIELGLDTTSIGEDLGWSIDNGLIDIEFSAQIAEDGTPCIVVDYTIAPEYDYFKLM